MRQETILKELNWRGLLQDCTDDVGLTQRLDQGPTTLYAGFDPTADSLHVGHLLPLLVLRRFQEKGHCPIALAGGATGSIGDPSGKNLERQLLSPEEIAANVEKIKKQLQQLLDFNAPHNPARLEDNAQWFQSMSFLPFLRDIGKHFSVNAMVAKESVKNRMEGTGISYTEFSYMLLQAYDFFYLHQEAGCELQIGGSDQWGNITAGMDLIRRKTGKTTFGLTVPLLTKTDGRKWGKTEGEAIWLDPLRTSTYRFYQFWINTEDAQVLSFLKFFTFLTSNEIADLEKNHQENPGRRGAHRVLAQEVTKLVHGEQAMKDAVRASEILFGGEVTQANKAVWSEVIREVASCQVSRVEIQQQENFLPEILMKVGLCSSKGQARREIQGGGIYLNNSRIQDPSYRVTLDDFLLESYLLLRKGKKNYAVMQLLEK